MTAIPGGHAPPGSRGRGQIGHDPMGQARSGKHQCRIDLDQRRAGRKPLPDVVRRADAPRGHQIHLPVARLPDIPQRPKRKGGERTAAQAAGLVAPARPQAVRPRDRRVAHDHGVGGQRRKQGAEPPALLPVEVGRKLYPKGRARGQDPAHMLDDPAQAVLGLEIAQPGSVRRRYVDRREIRRRPDRARHRPVIPYRIGTVPVHGEIDADHTRPAAFPVAFEPPGEGGGAVAVEAHAVDHRTVPGEAEQPRLRIAPLRTRRDPPDLHEPETQSQRTRYRLPVLVEARSQSHGVGRPYAAGLDRNGGRGPPHG